MDLKAEGWNEMHFFDEDQTALAGQGWLVIDKNNVNDYDF